MHACTYSIVTGFVQQQELAMAIASSKNCSSEKLVNQQQTKINGETNTDNSSATFIAYGSIAAHTVHCYNQG